MNDIGVLIANHQHYALKYNGCVYYSSYLIAIALSPYGVVEVAAETIAKFFVMSRILFENNCYCPSASPPNKLLKTKKKTVKTVEGLLVVEAVI